jgi:hypothetical protein
MSSKNIETPEVATAPEQNDVVEEIIIEKPSKLTIAKALLSQNKKVVAAVGIIGLVGGVILAVAMNSSEDNEETESENTDNQIEA